MILSSRQNANPEPSSSSIRVTFCTSWFSRSRSRVSSFRSRNQKYMDPSSPQAPTRYAVKEDADGNSESSGMQPAGHTILWLHGVHGLQPTIRFQSPFRHTTLRSAGLFTFSRSTMLCDQDKFFHVSKVSYRKPFHFRIFFQEIFG